MGICYIFGAGEGFPQTLDKKEQDLVIAADAGIKPLEKLGITPDISLGDFDSLGFVPECSEVIKHPIMKNDTDMLLAVKTGFERGYKQFVIYGGGGGRPDHTYANYQTLTYIAKHGGIGFLYYNGFTASVVINGGLEFFGGARGELSLFSLGERAKGVTLKGLLYPLDNGELSFSFPMGVSNEFIGQAATVRVSDGALLAMWRGDLRLLSSAYTLRGENRILLI